MNSVSESSGMDVARGVYGAGGEVVECGAVVG